MLNGLAMVGERKSLRALCRLNHGQLDPTLHGVDLAGQHAAAVRRPCMTRLQLTQAPIDAPWMLIKKPRTPCTWVIPMI